MKTVGTFLEMHDDLELIFKLMMTIREFRFYLDDLLFEEFKFEFYFW